ncbi:hypothetical protein GCM10029963_74390 [Micromonospora andamanensis]|uniref:hypothetical protein n=1 Tax=Micromonospora andamanensis TaxID=1287068 RepID=UPI00194FAEC6|nr:hypothetical protein [Micromonospora andamanensis]GIJ39312.1 hypothetical protein Vwe01_26370 [Micromonospora andamanensis]
MSLYTLAPRPGYERYTIQVGWNPHRTYFATVVDLTDDPAARTDTEPVCLRLGLIDTILDPSEVLDAVRPYAVVPADLAATLDTDQAAHPAPRSSHLTGTTAAPTSRCALPSGIANHIDPAALPASHPEQPAAHRRPARTTGSWFPPIAITGSRLLRTELHAVEQQSGYEFDYADTIAQGRRHATRRPLIIIGADLLARTRRRLSCRGLILVASVNPPDDHVAERGRRVGATYAIVLPTAAGWLAHHLLRDLPT